MRMFLVGMTDIFLILYLTSIANVQTTSFLTVEDFYKLRSMHETLKSDKQTIEENFQKQLLHVLEEKNGLAAKLAKEQERAKATEESLLSSDAKLARIDQDLKLKDNILKQKEQLLAKLDQQIQDKEFTWQKKEDSYKEELEEQKSAVEASLKLAQKLQLDVKTAQRFADQMKNDADQAFKAAEKAKVVQQAAIILKDAALKEKKAAEQKALEARDASLKAEAEKEKALRAALAAHRIKILTEQKANKLAATIKDIKQDSEAAYRNNVRPLMQQLNVTYEQVISNTPAAYKRELVLLPILMNGQSYVLFPSQHIGFSRRSDVPPKKLEIVYKGQKIAQGWLNKEDDLIAVRLPGFLGKSSSPYSPRTDIAQFMPILLALRNNGDISIGNLFRGLSDEFFSVNRDNIHLGDKGSLVYLVKGFRGTGMRAERVVQGDQLVDLNGRFIGIAKDADHIVRFESLNGWDEVKF